MDSLPPSFCHGTPSFCDDNGDLPQQDYRIVPFRIAVAAFGGD
jgi:hypothetical protein